ncbi:MAG: ABC transporter ATP-binding protein [Hyphomicrobiaceae bacterium]|nr:ABC transporter ATP-binding protein [Hyphomicrobiaceae bacterium]
MRAIAKSFGSVRALTGVDLTVMPGEIHALLGENGAGKSTLVKILYGALKPDSGSVEFDGERIADVSPAAARSRGIVMVFQHFSLFEALSVAENIALALPGRRADTALSEEIRTISRRYGLAVEPEASVAELDVGARQRVELLRCLMQDPRLLILDEPTSVLTPQEADKLFEVLRRLSAEGCSILYITHRLEEVRQLCSGATILRRGAFIAHVDPKAETVASLARAMVGSDVPVIAEERVSERSEIALSVRDLSLPRPGLFGVALKDVSLDLHAGEIVAIAGVAGNGQRELFDALSGEQPVGSGVLFLDEVDIGTRGIAARRRAGLALVPEERNGHAAVPGLALGENIVLTRHGRTDGTVGNGVVRFSAARRLAARIREAFDVRAGEGDPPAGSLSGGNLQKFVVGREIDRKPRVLVVNQPTWGVDARAANEIRAALIALARQGSAVLVISQDLDEVFDIADRIAVMADGRLSEPQPRHDMTREAVGRLMTAGEEAEDAA